MIQRSMTAQEFADRRAELPDAGQWSELIRGVPVSLSPPDIEHGNVVLNLSKALSAYVHATLNGYPCFDLGLHVEQRPDTVLFPAVSYFLSGQRFLESDKDITSTIPALVVELLSTNDRRRQVQERVTSYLRWGVEGIWLVDPNTRALHVIRRAQMNPEKYVEQETLDAAPLLPGLRLPIAELFVTPDWA